MFPWPRKMLRKWSPDFWFGHFTNRNIGPRLNGYKDRTEMVSDDYDSSDFMQDIDEAWDQFYKTPFRPKTLRTNVRLQNFRQINKPKTTNVGTWINLSIFGNVLGFWGIFKRHNFKLKFDQIIFIRKFRLKRFHKIDPRYAIRPLYEQLHAYVRAMLFKKQVDSFNEIKYKLRRSLYRNCKLRKSTYRNYKLRKSIYRNDKNCAGRYIEMTKIVQVDISKL
jgi:hypothetical protein